MITERATYDRELFYRSFCGKSSVWLTVLIILIDSCMENQPKANLGNIPNAAEREVSVKEEEVKEAPRKVIEI